MDLESEIGPAGMAVLTGIVTGHAPRSGESPFPWIPRRVLEVDHDPSLLDSLIGVGLVAVWDVNASDAPWLTLTPIAAFHLDVDLDEVREGEIPVWRPRSRVHSTKKRTVSVRRYARTVSIEVEELIVDHRAPSLEQGILVDPWTGEPVRLFQGVDHEHAGVVVRLDGRIS